ncbi:MAG: hypothetical protein ACK5IC_10635 [Moheibacter sp.]
MKSYEVHRIKKTLSPDSTEDLRKETEEFLNQRAAMGYKLISVDFKLPSDSSYIYAFIVFEK